MQLVMCTSPLLPKLPHHILRREVEVDFGCCKPIMTQHFLYGGQGNTFLQSQCCESMTQDVRRHGLCDLCPVGDLLDDLLNLSFPDKLFAMKSKVGLHKSMNPA